MWGGTDSPQSPWFLLYCWVNWINCRYGPNLVSSQSPSSASPMLIWPKKNWLLTCKRRAWYLKLIAPWALLTDPGLSQETRCSWRIPRSLKSARSMGSLQLKYWSDIRWRGVQQCCQRVQIHNELKKTLWVKIVEPPNKGHWDNMKFL